MGLRPPVQVLSEFLLTTPLDRLIQQTALLSLLRHLYLNVDGTGIFNLFPITYAFRPQLRDRLTLR